VNVWSLFSGVGGLDLGIERAGGTVVLQCEWDPYRRDVLAARFPGVPCFTDVAALRVEPAPLTSGGHPNSNAPGRRKEDDVNVVAFNASGGGEKGIQEREDVANPVTGSNGDPGAVAYALRKDPGGVGQGHNTNYVAGTIRRRDGAGGRVDRRQAVKPSDTRLPLQNCSNTSNGGSHGEIATDFTCPVIIGSTRLHIPQRRGRHGRIVNERNHVVEWRGLPASRPGFGKNAPALCGLIWGGVYVRSLAPDLPLCKPCAGKASPGTLAAYRDRGVREALGA
jgi:hypothetical protein